jgi:hypothetical protein
MKGDVETCPRCSGGRVVLESLWHRGTLRWFVPQRLKWWKLTFGFRQSVPNNNPERACLDCGLVWAQIDQDALERLVRELGDDETKRRLNLIEDLT